MINYFIGNQANYNDHWNYCVQNDIPCIRIFPGKKYSSIEYDVLSMLELHQLKASPMQNVIGIYKAYTEFFSLPAKQFSFAGGSNNLIFKVYAEHAAYFADQLFEYLHRYVQLNRIELSSKKTISLPKFKPQKPIAKLHPDEMILGGSSKYINPKRKLPKK